MPVLTRKAGEDVLIVDEETGEPVARLEFAQRTMVRVEMRPGYQLVRGEMWGVNPARRQPTGDEADRTD